MDIATKISTVENRASIVLIDVYKPLADSIAIILMEKSFETDTYGNPAEFLSNVHKYAKNIKICMGQDFGEQQMKGIELAKKLNKLGYTNLYLYTGYQLDTLDVPCYVIAIFKGGIDSEDIINILSTP